MAVTTDPPAGATAIRARIAATRLPEKEPVADASLDRGNHFAAWQEPELFTHELRAAFRSLR